MGMSGLMRGSGEVTSVGDPRDREPVRGPQRYYRGHGPTGGRGRIMRGRWMVGEVRLEVRVDPVERGGGLVGPKLRDLVDSVHLEDPLYLALLKLVINL